MATPKLRTVDQIKQGILRPALTSNYEVYISLPSYKASDFTSYLSKNGIGYGSVDLDNIFMACCEAVLPGSNLATSELNGDFTGVTERHVHRRIYDDRIDLSFYIQYNPSKPYNALKFFEAWMKYTTNESIASGSNGNSVDKPEFYYQIKYPKEYYGGLEITKFERDKDAYRDLLTYKFVNVYPISIASMPISYETSNLLKVTVSFSYIRYYVTQLGSGTGGGTDKATSGLDFSKFFELSPSAIGALNSQAFNPNINLSSVIPITTGGVSFDAAKATGNSINVKDAYSGNFNLNI